MLKSSVGQGGQNIPTEVTIVQMFLNDWLSRQGRQKLVVDGKVGPKTIGAITDFQKAKGLYPIDGRADPTGKTIRMLVDAQARNMVEDLRTSPVAVEIINFMREPLVLDAREIEMNTASSTSSLEPKAAFVEVLRSLINS